MEIRPIKALEFLAGDWKGTGTAAYPKINSSKYFDEITFEYNEAADFIFYVQKTWHNINDIKGDIFYMESGFIKMTDPGGCELSNTQSNGRTEVLQLIMFNGGNIKHLHFVSNLYGERPKKEETKRDLIIEGNTMKYEIKYTTKNEVQIHLVSTLKKEE